MAAKKNILWNTGMYLQVMLYVGAGINHFLRPAFYMSIIPPVLPWHYAITILSGIAEIVFGVLLLVPATRKMAAWGIIFLLVAVFPANVQMLINYLHEQNPKTWIAILRLPVQGLLIWWAYVYTRKKNQPVSNH